MPAPILSTVTAGQIYSAALHNERTRFLSPSAGDTMTDSWAYQYWTSATNQYFGIWIAFAQRASVPASITLTNQATGQPVGGPSVGSLGASGFKLYFKSTGANNNIAVNGIYTIQF